MGHHNRHFAGDRYAGAGVWGAPTSTANFCEEDYAVTLYIAEFMNTLTNLAYIYFAIRYPGVSSSKQTATKDKSHPPAPSWTRPDFLAVSLWILGTFSLVFHATLKHATQYGDEIAMLVLAGALLRGVWPHSMAATVGSAAAVVAASALYLVTAQILHHVFAFNSMILVTGLRTLFLIFWRRPVANRPRYLHQFSRAVGTLAFGYFLWQIDLEMCSSLRSARNFVGIPLAWLLEFHGWWHICTALGASLYIRLIRDIDP
ncbi:alkaline ceramidase family protein [Grosmannia clavigera kw1407]|uniref:Alkaline ceramidase family protein n=1 Tax=Grosmannia clavigera (strain kw1407 / UAMH 11150) TaxID=655863 RepID=F0X7V3_GROCL|nr:alkaline ceramidase family protein [Grosmannia clavigera kw1407]EFX06429.1 alkaline ceramidase family protein [Grosmannia clavigera kw1407]